MTGAVTKSLYDRLIADRPLKLNELEVNYRDGEGDERCKTCVHFFARAVDKFHVCEIFRPKDDGSVNPGYVCDFHSVDGENFPLLGE